MARGSTDFPAALAEEFQRLGHTLRITYPAVRSVLVTAAEVGEGTSTVALHLAEALAAQQPERVVVVDINQNRPALHDRFDLPVGDRVADGNGNGVAPWKPTPLVPNLFVLTAGARADASIVRPPDFLTSLVERLRKEFAYVVWDAPPVTVDADALELATLVDGVLVVVEPYRTPARGLALTRDALHGVKAFIIGAVVNRSRAVLPRSPK